MPAGKCQRSVHGFDDVFAEIQPQPARIRFVFGDVGFEYVDVLRNALAVVDDEKVDFVSVGARLQCDFGAFGMFDGVQNDVGRRVFQALLFCEYTKGLRHEIFQNDSARFAVGGTIFIDDGTNRFEIERPRGLRDVVKPGICRDIGKIVQHSVRILFYNVDRLALFCVLFARNQRIEQSGGGRKRFFHIVRDELKKIVPLGDDGPDVFYLPFNLEIEVCRQIGVGLFGFRKNPENGDENGHDDGGIQPE